MTLTRFVLVVFVLSGVRFAYALLRHLYFILVPASVVYSLRPHSPPRSDAIQVPIQAYIAYPSSSTSDISNVSSVASDSDAESLTINSDDHADSDSEDHTVLYMATRTRSPAQGKYRLPIKGCSGNKRNKKYVDLLQLKGQNMSCRVRFPIPPPKTRVRV